MRGAEQADLQLVQIVDHALEEAAARAGDHLECYRGCSVCCFGPFPITIADARRLQRGLAEASRADPELGERVMARARRGAERLAEAFPGDAATGLLDPEQLREGEFAARFQDVPCPALDPDSGACDLYSWRPIACRTYGSPLRIEGEDLPPCPLCFRGASEAEVEACRAVIDPGGWEGRLMEECERAGWPAGETVVAFALAGL
jgi:Fe-S-cluster containining protein